jgi:hypothetical protein
MKRDNPAKHFIFAFVIALLGYLLVYHFIENRRNRKGPWQVTFTNTPAGSPEIVINQSTLGIINVHICFPDQTVTNSSVSMLPITNHQSSVTDYQSPITISFNQPRPVPYNVPFGKCVFMDTTFLPGTLTLQFFGHEIELLPRVLVLDRQEHPWRSDEVITLVPMEAGTNTPNRSTLK